MQIFPLPIPLANYARPQIWRMIVLVNAAEMALAIKLRPNHRISHRYGLRAGFRDDTHNEGPLDVVTGEPRKVIGPLAKRTIS